MLHYDSCTLSCSSCLGLVAASAAFGRKEVLALERHIIRCIARHITVPLAVSEHGVADLQQQPQQQRQRWVSCQLLLSLGPWVGQVFA